MKDLSIYIPDCQFPSDNQMEIPSLSLDVQPTHVEIPFLCYGEQKRSKEWCGASECVYSTTNMNMFYAENELEIIPDTPEKVIYGWLIRDDNNEIGIYREKPTCDEDGFWDLTGEEYDLFPDITPDMLPKKYRITITPIE